MAALSDKDNARQWVRADTDGRIGLRFDEMVIYVGPDDELTLTRQFPDRVELYKVKRSWPVAVGTFSRGKPSLN